jgi:hypothetical protein
MIVYTYVVKNTGNGTLSGSFMITDDKLGTFQCETATSLAPDASITCTQNYTIQQSDLDSGSVTNIAYATSGTTQSPPESETVTASQNPHLILAKTATPNFGGPAKVGDTISYELVTTNDGNLTLNNVSVGDARLGTLSCDKSAPVTLAPRRSLPAPVATPSPSPTSTLARWITLL